ncbi:septum formation protein [Peptoniphilus ivorii]|uniref:Maf family protein n=1 Tax=Aedoeadaptatus ivorii TaxID=54006 RepID=UPI00278914D2|nr:nucleoside triphosphate pyrophosphatase [Peptoniphilus ivorii]MDQ0507660.1 septum formation protein [Peptoniphilus ivorii]
MGLILASNSPRRKAILQREGIAFTAISPNFEEEQIRRSKPEIYVMQLAYQKAMRVREQHPKDVILAADTVVVLGEEILGKPRDRKDAESMLSRLRGRTHRVLSGYCILGKEKYVDYEETRVHFPDFSDESMAAYLDRDLYADKAGAYGLQDITEFTVQIDGSYDNVVGLPVEAIRAHL